jgi:DnaJ-class molecular chaperone
VSFALTQHSCDAVLIVWIGLLFFSVLLRPGNVIAVLKTASHPRYRRDGDDLHATIDVTLKEALLGFKKLLPQLDGVNLEISRSDVTSPSMFLGFLFCFV